VADPVSIPTYVDMLLSTLTALDNLGGSGTNDEVDDAVSGIMGLTDDQLAVVFPPEARQKGPKVAPPGVGLRPLRPRNPAPGVVQRPATPIITRRPHDVAATIPP
jgi:hypothetical protein